VIKPGRLPRNVSPPLILAFVCLCRLLAQPGAVRAEFEVASIRPPNPAGDRGTNMSTNGGTLRMHNATLKFCLIAAYGIQESLIEGGRFGRHALHADGQESV
jgi:hypothetical protein